MSYIAQTLGLSRQRIQQIIKKCRKEEKDIRPSRIIEWKKDEIIDAYTTIKSVNLTAQNLNLSSSTVNNVLKRASIPRIGTARKYNFNEHFFNTIDNEEKAYWLGFIAADGCVFKQQLNIRLSIKDQGHLEKLKNALNGNIPIVQACYYGYPCEEIRICSKKIVNGLQENGIFPRKSLTLEWPSIKDDLLRHYLRGYIDGDGCWAVWAKNKSVVRMSVCCSFNFIAPLQNYITNKLDFNKTKPQPMGKIWCVSYGGKHQVTKLANFLYKDSNIWLDRKYNNLINHELLTIN